MLSGLGSVAHLAVLTSKVMHMLQFSALKPIVQMGCRGGAGAATIVHWWTWAAKLREEMDRRWPGGFGHRRRGKELCWTHFRTPNARCLLEKAERWAKVSHTRWRAAHAIPHTIDFHAPNHTRKSNFRGQNWRFGAKICFHLE